MAPCDAQALIAELQARVAQLEKELQAMTGEAVKHIVDKAKNAQTIADLSAENAELDKQLDEVMKERDEAEDALQNAHIALGGDGEWVGRLPPQEPPESGDLRFDVPELAKLLSAENAGLRSTGEEISKQWDGYQQENARLRERVGELQRRDEVAGIGFKGVAQELERLTERETLMTESIVWLLRNGIVLVVHRIDGAWQGRLANNGDYDSESPPEHLKEILAPLIAEATKEPGNE
jgi:hypothetical protein